MTEDTIQPKKEHQSFETFKAGIKWWIIGTVISFTLSVVGLAANALNFHFIDVTTIGSPAAATDLILHSNWKTGLFIVFSAIGVGGMVLFWLTTHFAWGKLIRLHKDSNIPDEQSNKEVGDELKKLRSVSGIICAFIFGIFMAAIAVADSYTIYVATGVNTTNPHSLVQAYIGLFTGGHIVVGIITAFGGAAQGFIMYHFKGEYDKMYERIQKLAGHKKES